MTDRRPDIVMYFGSAANLAAWLVKEREIVLRIPMFALRIAGSFTTTQRVAIWVSQ
ncbi:MULTISPECIES: hypothetical protein [unclassified Mesorhizobium]|uniref:hypothetical protein n=1 Tax=unclassified Mesorhizobium TaxID=325217 RepID=UPI0016769295|nr:MULTISPECIES: hypothetical protein [unclassified Mesorhizobium]